MDVDQGSDSPNTEHVLPMPMPLMSCCPGTSSSSDQQYHRLIQHCQLRRSSQEITEQSEVRLLTIIEEKTLRTRRKRSFSGTLVESQSNSHCSSIINQNQLEISPKSRVHHHHPIPLKAGDRSQPMVILPLEAIKNAEQQAWHQEQLQQIRQERTIGPLNCDTSEGLKNIINQRSSG